MAGKFRKTVQKLAVIIKKPEPKQDNDRDQAENAQGKRPPLSEEGKRPVPDLSDPTSFELLLDDSSDNQKDEERLQREKTLLSMELRHQKGISLTDDHINVPGRVPLMPVSLFMTLFTVVGFSAGLIHFSIMSPNYLLALFVISILLISQIVIYHSAYRTMRITITVIQTLGTIVLMALVGWAFYDLIAFNPKHHEHHFLLGLSLISFELVPLLMFLHLVFLGRSYRKIKIASPSDIREPQQKISFLPFRSKNALKPVAAPESQSQSQMPTVTIPEATSKPQSPTVAAPESISKNQLQPVAAPKSKSLTQIPTVASPETISKNQHQPVAASQNQSLTQPQTASSSKTNSYTKLPAVAAPDTTHADTSKTSR